MASTDLQQENPSVATETEAKSQKKQKKLHKKNVRRTAKVKLQLGQAQKSVQRAEQKVNRAQSKLEARKDQVQTLEEKLTRLGSEQPAAATDSASDEQTALSQSDTNSYAENSDVISVTNLSFPPPAEGRTDIPVGVQDLVSTETEGAYQSPLSATVGPVESSNHLPDEDAEASKETNFSSPPPVEGRDDITDIEEDTEPQHPAEDKVSHPDEGGSSRTGSSRSRRRSQS